MKMEGTLSQWDNRSGTGVIIPVHGHQAYSVTRADFPKGMNPRLGEELLFEAATGPNGQPCATAVVRPAHATPPVQDVFSGQLPPPLARSRRSGLPVIVLIMAVAGIGYYVFSPAATGTPPALPSAEQQSPPVGQLQEKARLLLRKLLAPILKPDH